MKIIIFLNQLYLLIICLFSPTNTYETKLFFEEDTLYHKYTLQIRHLFKFVRPIDFRFDFNTDRVIIRTSWKGHLNRNFTLHRDPYYNSQFFDKTIYFLNENRVGFMPSYKVYKTNTTDLYSDYEIDILLAKKSLDYIRKVIIADKNLLLKEQPELFRDRNFVTRRIFNKDVVDDTDFFKTDRLAIAKNHKNFDQFIIKY